MLEVRGLHAWYEESRAGQQSPVEAARFARENWTAFLPVTHEGWGRLLIKIAAGRSSKRRRREIPHELDPMTVG